jgi:hypothetical protein
MPTIINGSSPSITFSDSTTQTTAFTTTPTINTITSATATALTLQSAGTTAVTIDTSQNVGIGTASPSFKTEIVGGATTVETTLLQVRSNAGGLNTGTTIALANSTNPTAGSGRVELAGLRDTASGSSFAVRTADSGGTIGERMRINSSGTVFIGGTTSPAGTQRLVLTANGSAGIEPMLFNELRSTAATENYVLFYRNGSQVGAITNTLSSTAYVTSSDYRLKKNIAPMTGALATVQALKPVTYKWKLTGEDGQGFIAHELQAVVPDCVSGEKDAVDAEGNPKYQGIDTSFLVATLTAAIQELNAKVDAQAATITELQAEFDSYKAAHP